MPAVAPGRHELRPRHLAGPRHASPAPSRRVRDVVAVVAVTGVLVGLPFAAGPLQALELPFGSPSGPGSPVALAAPTSGDALATGAESPLAPGSPAAPTTHVPAGRASATAAHPVFVVPGGDFGYDQVTSDGSDVLDPVGPAEPEDQFPGSPPGPSDTTTVPIPSDAGTSTPSTSTPSTSTPSTSTPTAPETSTPPVLIPTPTSPGPTTSSPTTSSPTAPAPTTPAPTAPTPTTPAPTSTTSARLVFAPPTLVDPVIVNYPDGSATLKLDVTTDYYVRLPLGRPLRNDKGITITGGHNVVIIGGTVDVADGSATSGARRGMYLSKATPNGTTYVEGVRFLSSTQGSLTEGIDLASPGARVVLQNIAIDGTLSGSYATNHADAIQAWAGPQVLDIDGFSATTGYQGFFLLPHQWDASPVLDWSLHRIALTGADSAYLLWRDGGTYAIATSDVYVTGSHVSGGGLWPTAAAWPGVKVARAPLAYAASAGVAYVSPGYR